MFELLNYQRIIVLNYLALAALVFFNPLFTFMLLNFNTSTANVLFLFFLEFEISYVKISPSNTRVELNK